MKRDPQPDYGGMRFEIMLFERSHVCGRFIDGDEPSHWEPL